MTGDLELYGTAAGEVAAAMAGTSPGREGLDWAGDIIRGRRARTQIKVLVKTARALEEAGLSAKVVPDKTLVRLLEFAGLESPDDEDMTARWAFLLANAGSESTSQVLPSFSDLLRQLEPVEAVALDLLVDDDGRGKSEWTWSVRDRAGLRPEHLDNLERLGLVYSRSRATMGNLAVDQPIPVKERDTMEISSLGLAFVRACRAPRRP